MGRGELCPEDIKEEEEEADDGKLARSLENIGVDGSWVCTSFAGMNGERPSVVSTQLLISVGVSTIAPSAVAVFAISPLDNEGIQVLSDSFGRLDVSGLIGGIMEIIASAVSNCALETSCELSSFSSDAEEVAQESLLLSRHGGCGRIGKTNMVAAC